MHETYAKFHIAQVFNWILQKADSICAYGKRLLIILGEMMIKKFIAKIRAQLHLNIPILIVTLFHTAIVLIIITA